VDAAAAVNAYTHDKFVFRLLNTVLRERKREAVKPWFPFIKLLMRGLQALPPVSSVVTWRGVKQDLSGSFRKGKQFTDWSVVSTSTDELTVQHFLGVDGPRTLIRVQGATGVDIRKLSAFQESEVVYMPGTRFEVMSKIETGALTIVEIRELPPALGDCGGGDHGGGHAKDVGCATRGPSPSAPVAPAHPADAPHPRDGRGARAMAGSGSGGMHETSAHLAPTVSPPRAHARIRCRPPMTCITRAHASALRLHCSSRRQSMPLK
jgi:hypothetical protein